jgi:hypothetical protein
VGKEVYAVDIKQEANANSLTGIQGKECATYPSTSIIFDG